MENIRNIIRNNLNYQKNINKFKNLQPRRLIKELLYLLNEYICVYTYTKMFILFIFQFIINNSKLILTHKCMNLYIFIQLKNKIKVNMATEK